MVGIGAIKTTIEAIGAALPHSVTQRGAATVSAMVVGILEEFVQQRLFNNRP